MAAIHDLVLVYLEEQPLTYARVEEILPDHKPGWYHVELLLLQVPLQVVTWILRDIYIDGETFTMGGKPMRLEKVRRPEKTARQDPGPESTDSKPRKPAGSTPVIRLTDRKKN